MREVQKSVLLFKIWADMNFHLLLVLRSMLIMILSGTCFKLKANLRPVYLDVNASKSLTKTHVKTDRKIEKSDLNSSSSGSDPRHQSRIKTKIRKLSTQIFFTNFNIRLLEWLQPLLSHRDDIKFINLQSLCLGDLIWTRYSSFHWKKLYEIFILWWGLFFFCSFCFNFPCFIPWLHTLSYVHIKV